MKYFETLILFVLVRVTNNVASKNSSSVRPPLENETLDINGFGYNSIVLDTVGTIHRTFSHLQHTTHRRICNNNDIIPIKNIYKTFHLTLIDWDTLKTIR